ncbi:MAG: DUF2796 domain-containing protein [Pseudomonadota bacterium]
MSDQVETTIVTDNVENDDADAVMPDLAAPDNADPESVRQADSHVHGAADLALALDGSGLTIELESPLYNLIGFEHAPETDAQRATVETAVATLSAPSALFRFNPEAGCVAVPADPVHLIIDAAHNDEGHHNDAHDHEHDHDEHGHNDDHGHEHGDDHDNGEGHDHDHEDGHDHDHAHKDALLTYDFTCDNPGALEWAELGLFDRFDNLAEINLVYLGPARQMSAKVTTDTGRVQLAEG